MTRPDLLKEFVIPIAIMAVGVPMCILSECTFPSLMHKIAFGILQSGVLVLALLPPLQAGMGFNFGIGIGAWAAQVGFMVAASYGLSGSLGASIALALGLLLAASLGGSIGWLLSRMPGYEMIMTLFLVPLAMAPLWLLTNGIRALLPSPASTSTHGHFGTTWVNLRPFQHSLDFETRIGQFTIPIGTIVIIAMACLLILWFQNYQTSSKSVDPAQVPSSQRKKIIAFALSLMLVCTGHLAVIQNFAGMMPHHIFSYSVFPIIPALIAGGALLHKAKLHHAFLGILAWNLLYVPLVERDSPIVAMGVLSSGLILYALTRTVSPEAGSRAYRSVPRLAGK